MFFPEKIQAVKKNGVEIFLYPFELGGFSPAQIKKELDSPSMGDRRAVEFFVSRNLACWLAKQNGADLNWSELVLRNYSQLDGLPLFLSLSHTNSLCALAAAQTPVGVDVEARERRVPQGATDKFINDQDSFVFSNLLEQWCAKEAAFKACVSQGAKALKEIVIKQDKFHYHGLTGNFEVFEFNEYVVAVATAQK